MRQIFGNLGNGQIHLESVPSPQIAPGRLLIETDCSLISAGTERMLVGFGRGSLIRKVRQQPEKVRQVLEKIKTDGLGATIKSVRSKLADPIPLGYSQAGRVVAAGAGVQGFKVGDRVANNGGHAERVLVPANLCARIPDGVAMEAAAFTVVGAIGLQGIRLLQPLLGESVVVVGLGLIGQLAVQMLLAQGCRVLAVDLDPAKVALAESYGANGHCPPPGGSPLEAAMAFTEGTGVDGVLITASTPSNEPIEQAAAMCRQRGRIVLVGVVGLNIPRDAFYKKELTFQVSCSYGPGRYDPSYEEGGRDYPFAFVRWTEQRNLAAFLELLRAGKVRTEALQNASFPLDEAKAAYDQLLTRKDLLGVLLRYPAPEAPARTVQVDSTPAAPVATGPAAPGIAVIGAGNYTKVTLLPLLAKCPPHRRVAIASLQGSTAQLAAKRFQFSSATNDVEALLDDPSVQGVIITTRHDTHAGLVVKCLDKGKHVFVEKPLATTLKDLEAVKAAAARNPGLSLSVGFNRRHAPMSLDVQKRLRSRTAPLHINCLINAGALPKGHWAGSGDEGGGRLLGEGCHFIDLMRHWVGRPITDMQVLRASGPTGEAIEDQAALSLKFADGSTGQLSYLSNGSKGFQKEEFTLFWEGKVARIGNFKSLQYWGIPARPMRHWMGQQKGHEQTLARWIRGLSDPSERDDRATLFEVSEWAIRTAPGLAG